MITAIICLTIIIIATTLGSIYLVKTAWDRADSALEQVIEAKDAQLRQVNGYVPPKPMPKMVTTSPKGWFDRK